MKIGKYISELLFENDFVILPEIGEFSTKYIPAKFIPELRKVESPSKVVTFNTRNKTGGGILIEYVAKKESITTSDARQFIESFAGEMLNSLKSGKKVELEMIGVFSMNQGGEIVFEADTSINYLVDSAGMKRVSEPVKKSDAEAKTELDKIIESSKAPADALKATSPQVTAHPEKVITEPNITTPPQVKPVKPVIPAREPSLHDYDEKREFNKRFTVSREGGLSPAMKWVALLVVPVLVLGIILALNYDYLIGEKSLFREAEPAFIAPEITQPDMAQAADTANAVDPTVPGQPFDPSAAPATPMPGRQVFYIIVGSFEEEHSAIILAEQLRETGALSANKFPINRQGFFRVYYGFYYDLAQAEQILPQVQEEFPNAWILHR